MIFTIVAVIAAVVVTLLVLARCFAHLLNFD